MKTWEAFKNTASMSPGSSISRSPGETREMSEQARKCIWGTGRVNDPGNDRPRQGFLGTVLHPGPRQEGMRE